MYEYDSKTLQFKQVKTYNWAYFLLGIVLFSCISAGITYKTTIEYIPVIIKYEEIPFSEKNLKQEIANLHIKFPEIVYSQCIIEGASKTGNKWKNPIFLNGNNFLGLKKAYARPSTAISWGKNDYCIYSSWRDCIIDYSLYQSQNLRNVHTDQEYLQFLKEMGYSIDSNYLTLINKIYK